MAPKNAKKNSIPIKSIVVIKTFDIISKLVEKSPFFFVSYFAYKTIDTLAGKNTNANILIKLVTSIFEDDIQTILVTLTVISLLYAFGERTFRKKKTEYLVSQIHKLEKKIDPERKGSGLLPSGDTNPKDL